MLPRPCVYYNLTKSVCVRFNHYKEVFDATKVFLHPCSGKTSKMLANMVSDIEQGIVTPTTTSRLEELEKQQADIKEKVIIEESKSFKTYSFEVYVVI